MIEAIAASPAVYAIGWSLVQFAWQGTLVAAIAALCPGCPCRAPMPGFDIGRRVRQC